MRVSATVSDAPQRACQGTSFLPRMKRTSRVLLGPMLPTLLHVNAGHKRCGDMRCMACLCPLPQARGMRRGVATVSGKGLAICASPRRGE